jgi:glucose/arabinose dehydrogenase
MSPTVSAAALLTWLALAPTAASAISLPPGFSEDVIFENLTAPTSMAFAPDGRVFVAEKSGIIKVFDRIDAATARVFVDLRTNVHDAADRGLLAIRLHPRFPQTPHLYALYTHDAEIGGTAPLWGGDGGASDRCPGSETDGCVASGRLSRFEVSVAGTAGAEVVMLENWCQQFPSHGPGGMAFDAAGALFVSAGEGANILNVDYGQSGDPPNPCGDPPGRAGVAPPLPDALGGALRSQNIDLAGYGRATFSGKILRLDALTGAALPDNPLIGSPVPGADRIVAGGLRQPFRITVRPGTSEVWFGEVGWGAWEEINRLRDATETVVNFGWPCFQGSEINGAYAGLGVDACESLYANAGQHQAPYFSYSHFEPVVPGDGCDAGTSAITGLEFYTGRQFPRSYDGALFFADYARRCIWTMFADDQGLPNPATLMRFAGDAASPVELQVGPGGALFYVDVYGGSVRRISYLAGNNAPTAVLDASTSAGPPPLAVQFDATASSDADGDALTFQWDFDGDGSTDAAGPRPQHTYATTGRFTVTLTVSDSRGASTSTSVDIQVTADPLPVAVIVEPNADERWRVGDELEFRGESSGGALPDSAFSWRLLLHHCPIDGCHVHPLGTFGGRSGSFITSNHEHPSHLELQLTVTDGQGLSDTESVLLYPRTAEVAVETEPSGLRLVVGPEARAAPFSLTALVRGSVTVAAPEPQRIGCDEYAFDDWSDGGERSHEVSVPSGGVRLRARFRRVSDSACAECVGDCDGDGLVQVDEIVKAASIAIGQLGMDQCARADYDGDGGVTVDEVVSAIAAALEGCPSS